jgi:hypothetical protein
MTSKRIILSLYFVGWVFSSCTGPIEKRELISENPTEYIFKVPKDSLKSLIIASFNDYKWMHSEFYESSIFYDEGPGYGKMQISFAAETSADKGFGTIYFNGYKTSNDIFLYPMGGHWLSSIYHSRGKSLKFSASYVIKFTEIDSMQTKMAISPHEPYVINGTECCGPHGSYAKTFPVQGTTVEEYSLILFIAEQLGVKTLNPLNLKTKEER